MKARVEDGKKLTMGVVGLLYKGGLAHEVNHTDSEPRLSSIRHLIHSSFGFEKDF
jgi:hypothetical protein